MSDEQKILRVSLAATVVFAVLAVGFGLASGSMAIIFDGAFSIVDVVMSLISITVAGVIARSTSEGALSERLQNRFTMGFWHFEPMVIAVQSLLMFTVAGYAFFSSLQVVLAGGRAIEVGPALIYAGIVLVLTALVAAWEARANRRVRSEIVAIDVTSWLMAGGITAALLIAFVGVLLLEGTDLAWLVPYVDPAVLMIVALVMLPLPVKPLRKALGEIALVTPPDLRASAEAVTSRIVADQGFHACRVSAVRLGRGHWLDLVFVVPGGAPARTLEEWDALRAEIIDDLDLGDADSSVNILFTTRGGNPSSAVEPQQSPH